jgi:phosphoenolpyruvate carboxykinase (ATP)
MGTEQLSDAIRNIIMPDMAHWNLGAAQLLEHAVRRQEGLFASGGAYVVRTGQFTGRSPKDKFIVRDDSTESTVQWGPVNQPMSEAGFERLWAKMLAHCQGHDLFVEDCFGGADPRYALPLRVVTQYAWHALFARQLFVRPDPPPTAEHAPEFTLFFVPSLEADIEDGATSETCIVINFTKKIVLICGTSYAGEMKKAVFTLLNYLLPARNIMPMHCSCNVGQGGDVALFFGLSGTGKTTLSADPNRRLIGDDEHGWSDEGVFNFEGGCYAKCIHLSAEKEPQIWNAIRFGTVLENVAMDAETRLLDFDSAEVTENSRAAYPISFIDNAVIPSVAGHPANIILLTADAFGVLPPIARLTPEQTMYHFLSGYTAKVAGTERGLGKEPTATFSACFGAPFLPRPATAYASLLGDKLRRHQVNCWLLNTGWAGGPYGVGERMPLAYTRAMLTAALEGELNHVPMEQHPIFRVMMPRCCPRVPPEFLNPRGMWGDANAYDRAALDLSRQFNKNFEKFPNISPEIAEAAPVVLARA